MGKIKDRTGQRYGKLVVIEFAGTDRFNFALWRCRCDCGGESTPTSNALAQGRTKSCGCGSGWPRAEIAGRRFGKLVAIEPTAERTQKGIRWRCVCDCGAEKLVTAARLNHGEVISCGCAVRDPRAYWSDEMRAKQSAHTHRRRALKRAAGGAFTAAEVEALYAKQRGRCANCGDKLGDEYHRDHKVPLSRGGTNDILNIELLCGPCNLAKHAKDEIAWANENGRLL